MANETKMSFAKAQEKFDLTADKAVTRKFEATIVTIGAKDKKFLASAGFDEEYLEDEMLLLYAKANTTSKSGREWKEGQWCVVPIA